MNGLRIDVERFVSLTLALAAGACAPAPGPAPATRTIVAVPEPETAAEPETASSQAPEHHKPAALACDNDVGEVSCSFIDPKRYGGPMCEGFDGSCELLKKGYGYRRRVAAAVARCWESVGPRACDMFVRKTCYRKGLADACPDPSFEPFCVGVLERCKAKGQRADFSLPECVKALSSLEGGNLEWAKSAIGPSAEGCQLMFPVY